MNEGNGERVPLRDVWVEDSEKRRFNRGLTTNGLWGPTCGARLEGDLWVWGGAKGERNGRVFE